jgi:hypothetical protein
MFPVFMQDQVIDLKKVKLKNKPYVIYEILALLHPLVCGSLLRSLLNFVYFKVILRVLELEVRLFHKCGDLFELVVSIFWMMKENAIEHFREMAIKILGDISSDFFA